MTCTVAESVAFRLARRGASWCAIVSAAPVAVASVVNLLGLRGSPGLLAGVAFAVSSCALFAASLESLRQPRRLPVLVLALITVVALSFTGLGRNLLAQSSGTDVGMLLMLCVACVVLANQLAFWLARRNVCACE